MSNWAFLTMLKNEKFTLTEKIFRQINSSVISFLRTFLSRNFCIKSVRVNFGNFHTVHFGTTQKSQKIKPFLLQLCEHLVIGKFKRRRNINPYQTSRNHTFNDDFRNRTIIIIKLHTVGLKIGQSLCSEIKISFHYVN